MASGIATAAETSPPATSLRTVAGSGSRSRIADDAPTVPPFLDRGATGILRLCRATVVVLCLAPGCRDKAHSALTLFDVAATQIGHAALGDEESRLAARHRHGS